MRERLESIQKYIPLTAIGVLAMSAIFIWQAALAGSAEGELTVAFLDVGQGDAIFIESPTGRQVLIDGGRNRAVLGRLSEVMPFYDRSIDVVVATHPDADHIGGLVDVLERFDVDYIFESGNEADTAVYKSFVQLTGHNDIERVTARRGMRIDLGGGAVLSILFPDRDVSGVDANAASIVAKLSYGETDVMLTGDAPQAIEEYLAGVDGRALESEIVKVGHHGSRTSTAQAFVGFVSPDVAVISADRDNRYGHPHQEVLDTLARFNVETVGTYDEGTIIFTSDGTTFRRK